MIEKKIKTDNEKAWYDSYKKLKSNLDAILSRQETVKPKRELAKHSIEIENLGTTKKTMVFINIKRLIIIIIIY